MKRSVFAIMALAAALLVSCSKQERQDESVLRTVTMSVSCGDAAGKVMLDSGLETVWNAGDSVSVFYGGSSNHVRALYTGSDGAASGSIVFSDTARINVSNTIAAIPYRAGNSLQGSTLYSTIPSVQHYKDGSYDSAATLLVASSPSDELSFRYACSVLCVEIKSYSSESAKIQSLTLSSENGEYIAGNVAVDMTEPSSPVVDVVSAGRTSIVMSSAEASLMCTIPANGSQKFYFVAAPSALSSGCRFDVLLENGTVKTFRNTSLSVLSAGEMYTTRCGFTQMYSIIMDFNELSFNPALPTSKTTTGASGATHTFTNPSDSKSYSICAYSETNGYYRTKVSGYYCLRFNGPGDYLKLPSVSGKKLARFGAMVRQGSASYKPMGISSTKSTDADIIPLKNYPTGEMTWSTVSGVAADTPLYLYMSANNTQISRIELYFE